MITEPPSYEDSMDYTTCTRCSTKVPWQECPEGGHTCEDCWNQLESRS
jgi:hypothetical protein